MGVIIFNFCKGNTNEPTKSEAKQPTKPETSQSYGCAKPPMVVDLEKKYKTRGGDPVRLFWIADTGQSQPVLGAILRDGVWWTQEWGMDGSYYEYEGKDLYDLVEIPQETLLERATREYPKGTLVYKPYSKNELSNAIALSGEYDFNSTGIYDKQCTADVFWQGMWAKKLTESECLLYKAQKDYPKGTLGRIPFLNGTFGSVLEWSGEYVLGDSGCVYDTKERACLLHGGVWAKKVRKVVQEVVTYENI